jgi:hypothetical protein
LLWWIAQFDWLLPRQDFPVLPTGNAQFLLPYEAARFRREPSFKRQKLSKTQKSRPKIEKRSNCCG